MMPCEGIRTDFNDKWGCTMIVYDPYNGNRFLICKRAPGERFQPGTWGLPGGKVEIGECPKDGAVREVFEETGLLIEDYTYVGCYAEDGWTDFVFITSAFKGKVSLDPEECSDYRWVTMDEIETGYSGYAKLDIFKYTTAALQFYKNWKDLQAYYAIEKARQQVERQYP